MSYATVDEYRSKVQSGRPDTVEQDAVIQAALDAGHGLIEQRTGRRFDSYTATRTLDVRRRVLLPDLLTYSSTQWAIRRGYPFAGVEIGRRRLTAPLRPYRPHRRRLSHRRPVGVQADAASDCPG